MTLTITLKGMNDMKIRRIALICAIVILCISGALYGTIAYITAIDTATNVITTGDIKLKLIESAKAEDGSLVPFEDVSQKYGEQAGFCTRKGYQGRRDKVRKQ